MTRSKVSRKLCQERGCCTPWRNAAEKRCHRHRPREVAEVVEVLPVVCTAGETVGDCPNAVLKRGRCNSHQYEQYLALQPEALDMVEAGLMHWIVPGEDGCWLYENHPMRDHGGYGKFLPDGRWALVHKWLYMHLVGPVPNGHQLHHGCTVRNCCRPGHLQPVTPGEHAKLTTTDMAFRAMFPDEKITGSDRSHTDRERMFALVWGLPADTILTSADLDGLQLDQAKPRD